MQNTQIFGQLVNQVTEQQKIISELRNENSELRDTILQLKQKIFEMELSQASPLSAHNSHHHAGQIKIRSRKQIFTQSSPIFSQKEENKQIDMDDEMKSIELALELQRQEELQFQQRLMMLQAPQNPDEMDYEQLQELEEKMGIISKGYKQEQIENIMQRYQADCDTQHNCTICFSDSTEIALPCSHTFHNECLSQWFSQEKVCPVCKKEMEIEDISVQK